ncbi:unnamed protein product [Closterium sp. NIES-65]|nr:unnamed protein product [Closterium sp. NIES-65]
MAKNASKAGSPTAASGARCDGNDEDEANGDGAEEDWPENGHDDSASGDELGPAGIEEDEWWNRPVGSDDEVEEWRAGDSNNGGGENADGDNDEAAAVDANEEADDDVGAELETVAPADAVAESDKVAADAVLFNGEGGDDDPWSLGTDEDVPLLKRRLRHRLLSKSKQARVVLFDDDSPGEERRPILTAAEKGKAKVVEAPAKAPARRRTSNKKRTSDGDPRSSKGAAKKKAKKAPNPDDIVVNETLASDDEYAAVAGPIPTFPEKVTSKDPTLHNPNSRPPSPRNKDTMRKRRAWTVPALSSVPPAENLRRPPHPVVLQWIAEAWDQVPKQIIIDAFRHCGISSKMDGTENHMVMSHLRARSTTDVSADMSLGGTTGDNTRLLGQAPEAEEEEEAMQAEGVREVAVATGLEVLYQETPNYRGAAAEADHMIEPRETARHAWRVPALGVQPVVSAGEEAVTEGVQVEVKIIRKPPCMHVPP